MKHAAGSSLHFMLGKNNKAAVMAKAKKVNKCQKSTIKKPLDLVFNTVFINPDNAVTKQ